jgi:hypothetical protein
MFTLRDCEHVRLQLPALRVAGLSEPLSVHLDFDAESVDEIIERLTMLRAQTLPAPAIN